MRRKSDLPELLAPCGTMESLIAAISAGADAVYLGGKRFGARAYAGNFDNDELRRAVMLCHLFGVKLYVTINTLIGERELDEAYSYCEYLQSIGVDALIVCDIGLIAKIRAGMPELELHASTQMGIHNTLGADFAHNMGISRVVLARECSAEDIENIISRSKPEVEIFVHGAMCVCHSGQCLFSSMVGGRSGNRGECAQPCRLPYSGKYPLSLSDMSLAKHIPRIIASGAASLKIEGRMKSPEYVYTVVSVFRRLLDQRRSVTGEEMAMLSAAFSRGGGFEDSYYLNKKFSPMTAVRTDKDKQESRMLSVADYSLPRHSLTAIGRFSLGEAASLSFSVNLKLRGGKNTVTVTKTAYGEPPVPAISAPLTRDGLLSRIGKMGGTAFVLNTDASKITMEEGINLSPASINDLRRRTLSLIEESLLRPLDDIMSTAYSGSDGDNSEPFFSGEKPISASGPNDIYPMAGEGEKLFTGELNTAIILGSGASAHALLSDRAALDNMDLIFVSLEDYSVCREKYPALPLGIALPPIIMEGEMAEVRGLLTSAAALGAKYALVSNIGHIALLHEYELYGFGDFRLNVYNSCTAKFFRAVGLRRLIVSPELGHAALAEIGEGAIVLGRIPLMLTERCFVKENFGCEKCGKASLEDRYKKRFQILPCFGHRNLILNSTYTYMGDKQEQLRSLGIKHFHFVLADKNDRGILLDFRRGAKISGDIRRIGIRK